MKLIILNNVQQCLQKQHLSCFFLINSQISNKPFDIDIFKAFCSKMFFDAGYISLEHAKQKFDNELIPIFNNITKTEFMQKYKTKKKFYYLFPCFFE